MGEPRRWARRRARLGVVLVLVLATVAYCRFAGPEDEDMGDLGATGWGAEWAGTSNRGYTDAEVGSLARANEYVVIPKFSARSNLKQQFADVREIKRAAEDGGREVEVLMYFNAAFWFDQTTEQWGEYAAEFDPDWLAEDVGGEAIPFYGAGSKPAEDPSLDARGNLVDLTDPGYRAWAVHVIESWMGRAPISGIALDSAYPLLGQSVRGSLADGRSTFNDLFCGVDAPTDADGDCAAVAEWNKGLRSLLREVGDAIRPLGGEVLYNGVAPSVLRGEDRNIGLLDDADLTANEAFCLTSRAAAPLQLNDVAEDAEMMRAIAERGKKILQITNYGTQANRRWAPYCLGAFLIGWQPGSSWFTFHEGYAAMATAEDRPLPDLDLGRPTETGFDRQGDLLFRVFERGAVAVNPGRRPLRWVAPAAGAVQVGEESRRAVGRGDRVLVPARSAVFLTAGADSG